MRELITPETRHELKELYRNSPVFNAVVRNAEHNALDYVQMLEIAVITIANEAAAYQAELLKYHIEAKPTMAKFTMPKNLVMPLR